MFIAAAEPVLHFQLWQIILMVFVALALIGIVKKLLVTAAVVAAVALAFGVMHVQPTAPYITWSTPTVAAPPTAQH